MERCNMTYGDVIKGLVREVRLRLEYMLIPDIRKVILNVAWENDVDECDLLYMYGQVMGLEYSYDKCARILAA